MVATNTYKQSIDKKDGYVTWCLKWLGMLQVISILQLYCLLWGWVNTTYLSSIDTISTYCILVLKFRDNLVTKSPVLPLVTNISLILSLISVTLNGIGTQLLQKYVKYFCAVKFKDENSQECYISSFHWLFIHIGKINLPIR